LLPASQIADCIPEVRLGFDSLQRSLITTIKEAVDNALDACEGFDT
jgi:DNA topoisomerase VI subunit B